jgi:hypothetical protein
MLKGQTTRKQGDAGLGLAIGWFASHGYTVSVPLTDSQNYDLIVDNGDLKKVQVKSTFFKRRGSYTISLTTKGGTRHSKNKIKKFDKLSCDILFVVTDCGDYYLIPTEYVDVQHTLTLNGDWNECKVSGK